MSTDHLPEKPSTPPIDLAIRLTVLGLLGLWCFVLLRPFLTLVVWGGILAVALSPIFVWLRRRLGGHGGLAAALLTVAGIVIIVGPVTLLVTSFAASADAIVAGIGAGSLRIPPPPTALDWPIVGPTVRELWTEAAVDLQGLLERHRPELREYAVKTLGLAATTGFVVLELVAAMIIAGVLMPRSDTIKEGLMRFVERLSPHRGRAFVELAAATVRNIAQGVVGIALLQGVLLGLGFLFTGIPFAGLLTFLCMLLGIVQIGPGIVVLGTLVYAWVSLDTLPALLFTLWIVPMTLLDNVLKPIVMARGLPVPMLVIFLGVVGGVLAHGVEGVFVGPVVLAFGYELLRAWLATGEASAGRMFD